MATPCKNQALVPGKGSDENRQAGQDFGCILRLLIIVPIVRLIQYTLDLQAVRSAGLLCTRSHRLPLLL